MNITVNVPRRVIRSDNQAQNTRPTPYPRLAIPTIPPATIALALVSSSKMGASWEMMAMPADVLRKRISQSAHHCQALRASESTKSCVARCAVSFSLGVHPAGCQPSGGFRIEQAGDDRDDEIGNPEVGEGRQHTNRLNQSRRHGRGDERTGTESTNGDAGDEAA